MRRAFPPDFARGPLTSARRACSGVRRAPEPCRDPAAPPGLGSGRDRCTPIPPRCQGLHRPYTAAADRYAATEYRQVGASGLYLPPISLGLWWNFGDNIPFDRQRALLRHAFDKGITHFDLANNYGPPYGSAETNFGRMMREDFAPVSRRAHHLVQGRLRHVARARTATSARASTSSRAPSSR